MAAMNWRIQIDNRARSKGINLGCRDTPKKNFLLKLDNPKKIPIDFHHKPQQPQRRKRKGYKMTDYNTPGTSAPMLFGCATCPTQFSDGNGARNHSCNGINPAEYQWDQITYCTTCGASWLYWQTGASCPKDHDDAATINADSDEYGAIVSCKICGAKMPELAAAAHTHRATDAAHRYWRFSYKVPNDAATKYRHTCAATIEQARRSFDLITAAYDLHTTALTINLANEKSAN